MNALRMLAAVLWSQAWLAAPCAAVLAVMALRRARAAKRRWRKIAESGGDLPGWLLWWRSRWLMRGDVKRDGRVLTRDEAFELSLLRAAVLVPSPEEAALAEQSAIDRAKHGGGTGAGGE